jgi:hypothetical protein
LIETFEPAAVGRLIPSLRLGLECQNRGGNLDFADVDLKQAAAFAFQSAKSLASFFPD